MKLDLTNIIIFGVIGWLLYTYGPEALANYKATGKFIVHGGEIPGVPLVPLR